jgi:hypothetical protein
MQVLSCMRPLTSPHGCVCRHRERPKRPWSIWALDISKQGCSAGAGHAVGMCVAILAHIYSGGASECAW